MSVADNIKRLRELTEISQDDLAKVIGVSRAAVSLWEIGKTEPKMGSVQAIADHFHIKKANIIEEGGMDHMAVSLSGRLYEIDPNVVELSDAELELINLFRMANAQGRESILAVARVSSQS